MYHERSSRSQRKGVSGAAVGAVFGLGFFLFIALIAASPFWALVAGFLPGTLGLFAGLIWLYDRLGRWRYILDAHRGLLYLEGRLFGLRMEWFSLQRLEQFQASMPAPQPGGLPAAIALLASSSAPVQRVGPSTVPAASSTSASQEDISRSLALLILLMAARGQLVLSRVQVRHWYRLWPQVLSGEPREELLLQRVPQPERFDATRFEQSLLAATRAQHGLWSISHAGRPVAEVIRALCPTEGSRTPGQYLARQVGEEAVSRGLGQWEKGAMQVSLPGSPLAESLLQKLGNLMDRYAVRPEHAAQLAAAREAVHSFQAGVERSHAEWLSQLEDAVSKGLAQATSSS